MSVEFGPTIGRSGDSPVSDGACWIGCEERLDVVGMAGDHRPALDDARAHAEHLAETAARPEDELDLADAEAQRLARGRQRDLGRLAQVADPLAGRARGRRLGLADQRCGELLRRRGRSHGYGHVTT